MFSTENIALDKPAKQSSTKECPNNVEICTRPAEFAVDGDKTTCTHTELDTKAWWSVDLRQTYTLRYVELTNHDHAIGTVYSID